MKHLKKYKVFESYNRFGTKTLTEKEFDQIRKENCKNWTKVETEIYRGMPDLGNYLLVDPLKGDFRTSIEDTNIHLDLMSNLPSWKDYPKYERCVIALCLGMPITSDLQAPFTQRDLFTYSHRQETF